MSSFDLGQQLRSEVLIPAQEWDGDADLTTSDALAVNVANVEGVAVQVATGTVAGSNDIEIAFYEGDENDFTVDAESKIDDKYIVNSPEMDDTSDAAYIHSIKTNKPYLKVVVSRTGSEAAAISVSAILGYLANAPA